MCVQKMEILSLTQKLLSDIKLARLFLSPCEIMLFILLIYFQE